MKFWDSSAIVPLLVQEATSDGVLALLAHDAAMLVAWTTETECTSAVARLERLDELAPHDADDAFARLDALRGEWLEVEPVDMLRQTARRLLRVHDLRAADAIQLASAIAAAEGHPPSLEVVTLDERLAAAARREGFVLSDVEASDLR